MSASSSSSSGGRRRARLRHWGPHAQGSWALPFPPLSPLPFPPAPPLLYLSPPLPSHPLEVGPLNTARGSGGAGMVF